VFIREQFDDDDGAGKCQSYGDVDRFHCGLAHQQGQHEAKGNGEGQLPQPGRQRHGPYIADMRQIELEADHEQQNGHANLCQQVDLVLSVHGSEHRRAKQNTDHDVGDQQWLTQAHGDCPDDRRNHQ